MTEEKTEETKPIIAEVQGIQSVFSNKDIFEHGQRVAVMLSKSDLVPKQFQGNVGNCIIALEMANRIGASPLMVMQNLYVVHGKPAWSSQFLIATVNASGKFSPLRYEEDEVKGGRARAWAYDKSMNEKIYGPWVSMEMARAEGWVDKAGSKWKTMPELMMRYRAATFFARQFAPELSMGINTYEEAQDITYNEPPQRIDKEAERIRLMIGDATTVEELKKLQGEIDPFKDPGLADLLLQKMEILKNGK